MQLSQQLHLSEYPNDAWASRVLVSEFKLNNVAFLLTTPSGWMLIELFDITHSLVLSIIDLQFQKRNDRPTDNNRYRLRCTANK